MSMKRSIQKPAASAQGQGEAPGARKLVQASVSTAMNISGPVAMDPQTPSVDLLNESPGSIPAPDVAGKGLLVEGATLYHPDLPYAVTSSPGGGYNVHLKGSFENVMKGLPEEVAQNLMDYLNGFDKPLADLQEFIKANPERANARLLARRIEDTPRHLLPDEKERRLGFFSFDLSEAFSKFDEVERSAGPMLLKCSREMATMSGGSTGDHTLHRTSETRREWIKRISIHWAGYLENNGRALMRAPEEDGSPHR